jgi:hypothetical protein
MIILLMPYIQSVEGSSLAAETAIQGLLVSGYISTSKYVNYAATIKPLASKVTTNSLFVVNTYIPATKDARHAQTDHLRCPPQ